MVKRTVQFTATADGGVTPAIPVFGGVKGEHNATVLDITLDSGIYTDGDLVRLSFTTGDGTVLSSDLIEDIVVTDGAASFAYPLAQLLTVAAGQLCVRAVVTKLNEDGEETAGWRSGEMVLYFEHADIENGTPFWTGVSEMLSRTVAAKDLAVEKSHAANAHQIYAENARDDAENAKTDAEDAAEAAEVARDAAVEAQRAVEQAKSDINGVKEFVGNCTDNAIKARNVAQQAATAAENAAASAWEAVDTPGRQGPQGERGTDGKSAYEIAVANGFEGDEAAWLASLKSGEIDVAELEERIDAAENNIGGMMGEVLNHRFDIAALKNETLKYKGSVSSGTMLIQADKQVGDVWFIENENGFYMWDGAAWTPLGTSPDKVVAAMNTEVWSFELEDGTTVEKAVPTV